MITLTILFALAFFIISVCGNPIHQQAQSHQFEKLFKRQSTTDYFSNLASSPVLVWSPCYSGYQCARLEVPLDYSKPVAGDVFKLAIVKLPAQTSVPYKGSFFLMNGLQSNVDGTADPLDQFGDSLGSLYQESNLQGYDIISWDTRGVGHSTPAIQCFANAASESAYAIVERLAPQLGSFNGTYPPTIANIQDNIQKVSAHQQTFGPGCQQYYGHYLPYIGTADNARDLNQIIKLIGGGGLKAMYLYGYSTVLGATFASMFPNAFDRMTLDGVVNTAKLYLVGDNGPSSIIDANKAVQVYFDSCSAAGPCTPPNFTGTCCAFWASTPALVQARYERLKAKYYYKPFKSVPPSSVCGDCTRDYYFIATGLADIIGLGPLFVDILSQQLLEWETGTATPGGAIEFFYTNFSPSKTYDPYPPAVMALDQSTAIQGLIAQGVYLVLMNATSSQVGPIVANQELYAANFGPTLKNPYLAPIGGFTAGRKMLFLGNSADPQTPISNAKLMSAIFPGSGVVEVNALGSTTFWNGDSPCLDAYRTAFVATGAMPPQNAYCNDIQNGLFGKPYVKDYR